MPKTQKKSWADMLQMAGEAEKPSDEWKTRTELQVIWGVRRSAALEKLEYLQQTGLVERKDFAVNRNGVKHVTPHYRIL
jgi:predicted transcriptional regulator